MMKFLRSSFVLGLLLAAQAARADVAVSRVVKSGGAGGMGASEIKSEEFLQGLKKRTDSTVSFKSAMMNKMAGGERTEIVDVAADKTIHVDHKKKTYRETSLSEAAKLMQGRPDGGREEKPTHRVSRADFSVQPKKESKTINGFRCENYELTMRIEIEDLKTKDKAESRMVSVYWTAAETPELQALQKEERAFAEAYLKKLGWDASPDDMNRTGLGMGAALMGVGEEDMKPRLAALKKESAKIKGFPVRIETRWETAGDPGSDAKVAAAKKKAASAERESDAEGLDISGGAAGALGGLAAKMARKKMAASAEKRAAESDGGGAGFTSTVEVLSVKTGALPADAFAVPAGYKQQK